MFQRYFYTVILRVIHSVNVNDNINNISKDKLNIIGSSMVKYFHRDIYKDWIHGLLKPWEVILISILIVIAILVYLLKLYYKLLPSSRFLGIKIENIYYSSVFRGHWKNCTVSINNDICSIFNCIYYIYT